MSVNYYHVLYVLTFVCDNSVLLNAELRIEPQQQLLKQPI